MIMKPQMAIQYNVDEKQFFPYYGYESPAERTSTTKTFDNWSGCVDGKHNKDQETQATTDIVAVATLVTSNTRSSPSVDPTIARSLLEGFDVDENKKEAEKQSKQETLALVEKPSRRKMTLEQKRMKKVEQQMTVLPPKSLQVPKSTNPSGSDAVHPSRPVWKATRGAKTTTGALAGAVVGGICAGPLFPIGIYVGGAAGAYATNKISKIGERRAQRCWEQSNFQKAAKQSMVIKCNAVFV